jgi:hypothetical protein
MGDKIFDAILKLLWCAVPASGTFWFMQSLGESIGIRWLSVVVTFLFMIVIDNQNEIKSRLDDKTKHGDKA